MSLHWKDPKIFVHPTKLSTAPSTQALLKLCLTPSQNWNMNFQNLNHRCLTNQEDPVKLHWPQFFLMPMTEFSPLDTYTTQFTQKSTALIDHRPKEACYKSLSPPRRKWRYTPCVLISKFLALQTKLIFQIKQRCVNIFESFLNVMESRRTNPRLTKQFYISIFRNQHSSSTKWRELIKTTSVNYICIVKQTFHGPNEKIII